jgi:hypothetical protein
MTLSFALDVEALHSKVGNPPQRRQHTKTRKKIVTASEIGVVL